MQESINIDLSIPVLPLLVLTGKSGSGKTTTAEFLHQHGLKKVVTYTTRPKREGEKDGIDYHFVSKEEFKKMIDNSKFLEYAVYDASFGRVYYGSLKEDYNKMDSVIVLNPKGVEKLLSYDGGINALIVELVPSKATLKQRLSSRGDSPAEIERRLKADDTDFIHLYQQKGSERILQIPIDASDTSEAVADKVISSIKNMIQKK